MRIQKYRILEKILGIVPREFPGIVLKNFSLEIPKNFHKFCLHFLQCFFSKLVTRNALKLVTRNSLDFTWNGLQEIPGTWILGMGYEKFLGIAVDIFTGFSCERFLGISADVPQNCYLGHVK